MNNKADRYAILRLGQKGRARGTDGVKRRWEVGNDTETGNQMGRTPSPERLALSGGAGRDAGSGARG